MPGLEPGIHVFLVSCNKDVDGRAFASPKRLRPRRRDEPGHDEFNTELPKRHMAVLVTRPHPDSATTAAALRAKGYAVMQAPMLRFEPVACSGLDAEYGAVLATSVNALRAVEGQLGE